MLPRTAGLVLTALLVLSSTSITRSDGPAQAARLAAKPVATVRAIKRGLLVAPPRKPYARGKVKQALRQRYALRTGKDQRASLGFVDQSVLHINQRTDAVLASPTVTQVKRGEVDAIVKPGTTHEIQTAVAIASAIGTEFDVRCSGRSCTFTVVEGAILVTAANGAKVTVKTNQRTTVARGQAPTTPSSVDAAATVAWTRVLPPPPPTVGANLALDANGGQTGASSTRPSSGGAWDPGNVNDGNPATGWQSGAGGTTDQMLTFSFANGATYRLTGIIIDPAATGGEDPTNDLNHFAVSVSRDGAAYTQVLTGQTQARDALQSFTFPQAVDADHLQLRLLDNWGGKDGIAVSEVIIVGRLVAVATPLPTSTPTPTATSVPGANATISVARVNSVNLFPPDPLACFDKAYSQFTLTGSGLIPSGVYDVALTGSAGGVTLNVALGSITANAAGVVTAQVFTLPEVPAHNSWTVNATPRGGGIAPTAPLSVNDAICVLPSVENTDRSFTVKWGGSGWAPGSTVTLTIKAAQTVVDRATVGPDGTVAPRTVVAQCAVGVTPSYTLVGSTLDDSAHAIPLANSLTCT